MTTQTAPLDRPAILGGLSTLLSYPGGDLRATLARLLESLGAEAGPAGRADARDASLGELIRGFERGIAGLTPEETEELYTRTFDLNPAASLETGWQLYGEAYERGAFLVKMRELLRAFGVPEAGELPDHLTLVLRAMSRMPEAEAGTLSTSYIRKAVANMIAAFPDAGNPYLYLLRAASLVAEGTPARKENRYP